MNTMSSDDSEKHDPPEPTTDDKAHSLAKAGLASVPVVGGAAAEFFDTVVTPPLEKRRQEWMQQIAESLRELEQEGAIESGSSATLEDLGDEDDYEQIRAAERRWTSLQSSHLRGLKILLLLKTSVGQDWLRRILDDTRVEFSRDGDAFTVGDAFSLTQEPNTKVRSPDWDDAVCSFWKRYKPDPSYWVRRISRDPNEHSTVAGFDTSIPWTALNLSTVSTLGDLGQLSHIGVGLPPEAFKPGVEEFLLTFVGNQFSFSLKLSEHGLEPLHEVASTHFQMSASDESEPLSLGTSFRGVDLLEIFRKQMPSTSSGNDYKPGFRLGGMSGPNGKNIHFYPSFPPDFLEGDEIDEYAFKVTVPDTKQAEERIDELEAAVADGSADADVYVELAARYRESGRLSEAIRCLEHGIEMVTPSPDLYCLLGEVMIDLGRYEDALVQLKEGEKIEPEHAGLQSALGICLDNLGKHQDALDYFEAAVRLEPSEARHHKNLGRFLAKLDKDIEATEALEKGLELAPDDSYYHMLLGALYEEIGQPDDAELHFKTATEVAPNDPDAHENLGRYLASIGQYDRAIPVLERAVEMEESARRHELLGGSYGEEERWSEAEASFRRAASLAPDNAQILHNLGICIMNQGKLDEAIGVFEKELELSPGNDELQGLIAQLRKRISEADS